MPYLTQRDKTAAVIRCHANRREWLASYKIEHGCTDCGVKTLPACAYDFDHVRGEKRCLISRLGISLDRLLDELEKCEVVCANCHRIRTESRRK